MQYSSMLLVSLRLGKQKWSAKEVCRSLFWLLEEIVVMRKSSYWAKCNKLCCLCMVVAHL